MKVYTLSEWNKQKKKRDEKVNESGGLKVYSYDEWAKEKGIQPITSINEKKIEDIAPVRESTSGKSMVSNPEGQKDSYLQKGALSGGVSLKNISTSLKATEADMEEDATKGILGLGERIWDGFVALAPYVAQADYYRNGGGYNVEADKIFNDAIEKSKQSAATYVAKDLIDEEKIAKRIVTEPFEKKTGINMEASSFIGSKGDSLVQSASDMLARQGLNYLVPGAGLALTGLSSFGGETENAFNQGAKYEDAVLSGFISATAEVGTEKIAGIKFGGKTLTDGVAKNIAKRASKEFLGTLAKWGFNTVGEGAEEVLSGYATAIGQKLTYMNDKEISELFSKEDAKEEFFAGAILGGMFEAGSVAASGLKGTDYVTELDKNEKQVIDAVYNEMLAEKETEGKKLTQSEKSKLYDSVEKALEKGYIDIETIEKTLGGDTYKAYKNASDSEDALKKEYEELGNTSNPTLAQTARYHELTQKVKDLETNSTKGQLKDQMSKEVFEKVKNTRLVESYNEKTRRSKVYEADLTKYDTKQQEVVKRAVESGILNNTNRTHEFVDMIAKISADKGVLFDFTNNQKLKESGLALEGKTINGFVKDGNISLNIDSAKSLNTVVGHEITHVLEGTELYTELQNVVKEYATTKGEYDTRYKALERLYEGVEANIDKELTADLIGEYLFTDSDFVSRLSTEKPNIFKRVYEEIKYLYKVATAGSKEARELEKVKKAFDKAYKEITLKEAATEKGKFSFSGVNAITANSSMLLAAEHMLDTGVDSETVRRETGWYKGYDGKMRFEIDDSKSELVENPKLEKHEGEETYYTGKLSDILKHDELYEAYPQLRNVNIVIQPTESGLFGVYQPNSNYITLNIGLLERPSKAYKDFIDGKQDEIKRIEQSPEYKEWNKWYEDEEYSDISDTDAKKWLEEEKKARDKFFSSELGKRYHKLKWGKYEGNRYEFGWSEKAKTVLMHEIQHAIQKIEGFASGTNPSYWNRQLEAGFTIKTEEQKKKLREAESRYYEILDKNPSFFFEMNALYNHAPDVPRGKIDWDTFEKIEEDPIEWQEFDRKRDALEEKYGSLEVIEFFNLKDKLIQLEKASLTADEAYYNTAGEIEARDVEKRLTLNAEQRKRNRPNIDSERVVFADKAMAAEAQKNSLSDNNEDIAPIKGWNVKGSDIAYDDLPIRKDLAQSPAQTESEIAPITQMVDETTNEAEEFPIKTTADKLNEKQKNLQTELDNVKALREQARQQKQDKINSLQATYDALKNKDTKKANALKLRIEKQKRIASDIDSTYEKRIDTITKRQERIAKEQQKDHANKDRLERAYAKIDRELAYNISKLEENFDARRKEIASELESESAFISNKASEIYDEITHIRKGVRASEELGYLLDMGFGWEDIKKSLLRVSHSPTKVVTKDSACESVCREVIEGMYMDRQADLESLDAKFENELAKLKEAAESAKDEARVATQRRVKGQEYTDLIKTLVGNTSTWVDKKLGIKYKINTLKRNLRDIVRDENGKHDIAKADAIYNELEGKYDHNEALLKKESRSIKQPYAEMKITKAEDKYIQMLGEFRHNPSTTLTEDDVKEFYEKNKSSINAEKVDKIIEDARATYDSLLERVNEVLHEQGMQEIPYRKGYFPHFTDEKQSFLAKLFNWKTINTEIPTSIAGLTEEFNPNRSWQSFNKQRISDDTDYSFMKGLDTYVHGALDWIYHIEDIQKRRALENHIRYTHSPEKVQREIDRLIAEDKYDADTLQDMINGLYAEANNPLNNFVTDLRIGTNNLANKKDSMDRGMEAFTNRKFYSTMTNLSNRVTANHVAGSISSALTNFIPITQSWGEVSPVTSLQAMKDTMKSALKDDGIVEKSDFLTNRLMEEENLYKTKWDKANEAVTFLMTAADSFTSQTVWRSKYIDNISKGMSENEAIKNADEFAKGLIAGRSRGNMPTIFNAKNPLIKVLTAFQLEVNNHYGYMFKDMPQAMKDEGTRKLVGGYVKMFLGAYAYNALYSSLTGRDAAFDPIGIVEDLLRDLGMFWEDDEEEPVDAILNLTENVTDELPFVGGLLGGGRIPIASALPYGEGIVEAYTETAKDISDKDWTNLTKEWMNPFYYLVMPMGGGQLRKTVQGLSMFDDDLPIAGSYTDGGNLRFTVDDTIKNRVQAGLFGQYASENAREYFDRGEAPLKEKQIQELVDLDLPIRDYWDYRKGLKEQNTLEEKFEYVAGQDVSDEQKNIMINNVNGVSNRKEKVDISNYDDFSDYEEFDFYSKHKEKYNFLKDNHISYSEYISDEETKGEYDKIYDWYKKNHNEVTLSKVVTDDVIEYRRMVGALKGIQSDKDENGSSISGSAKEKKIAYINGLDLDYGQKIILFRTLYNSEKDKETYNADIVDYLNDRKDLSYDDIVTILTELDFTVHPDGTVEW